MGLPDDQFVDPTSARQQDLYCSLCMDVFEDPVFCPQGPCQHVFCRECLTKALEKDPRCPLDRMPMGSKNITSHLFARSAVARLPVHCSNKSKGCHWQGSLESLHAHEVTCPCGAVEELTARLQERDGQVRALQAALATRDARIRELESQREEVTALETIIAAKGDVIESLKDELRRYRAHDSLEDEFRRYRAPRNSGVLHRASACLQGQLASCEELSDGDLYCLVDGSWYSAWVGWATRDISNAEASLGDTCKFPGCIDNTRLLDPQGHGESLRQDLVEGTDFIPVSGDTWELLNRLYGGGPVIRRRAVSQCSGDVKIDLMGMVFKVHRSSTVGSIAIVESPTTTVEVFKERMCDEFGLDPDEVRVWDFLNGDKYVDLEETPLWTLEACNLFNGNDILLDEADRP